MRRLYPFLLITLLLFGVGRVDGQDQTTPGMPKGCPTLTVTGPAGFVAPGGIARYTARIEGKLPAEAKVKWSVDRGTILEGQGTTSMNLRLSDEYASTTVTVNVLGLPAGCSGVASETMSGPHPPTESTQIDEFSIAVGKIDKVALAAAAKEAEKNPTNQLYIIEYFPLRTKPTAVEKKVSAVKEYLSKKLGIDPSRITIIVEAHPTPLTKIYRVPPGASNPNP